MRSTLLILVVACRGSARDEVTAPPIEQTVHMSLVSGSGQSSTAGTRTPAPVVVRLADAAGRGLRDRPITLGVMAGGGWVVATTLATDSSGEVHAEWYLGPVAGTPQQLRLAHGASSVQVTATATAPVPGTIHTGSNQYVEYIAGDGPLILTAPHGGALTPSTIPDRTTGTTVTDANTEHLTRALAEAAFVRTGRRPHLVISRLRRIKLDPNRDIGEGAGGNAVAEVAWREYHGFIEAARAAAGAGALYVDVHGHGHAEQRIEWGYLLGSNDLARSDAELDADVMVRQTSIRRLVGAGSRRLSAWIRGAASLGAAFEAAGYPSMPSPTMPAPGSLPYFSGGYSTERHGSRDGGSTDAVQLEANFAGVRDTEANRLRFAAVAAPILAAWGR